MKIKKRIHEIINPSKMSAVSKAFDIFIICLILLNVITVIADTFKIPEWLSTILWYIEFVSVIIFTVEYILRIYIADLDRPDLHPVLARLRYMVSFMAMVDLLAILPFYIPFVCPIDLRVLRILRVFRLFRIFKLNRYTSAMSSLSEVLRKKKHQLITSIAIVFILMIISSVLMYSAESEAQPEVFDNALSSMWWTIETLTTVGYGDVVPVTITGKILSTMISLLGIGLVAVPTGIITAGFSEMIEERKKHEEEHFDKIYCPYCGKKLN